MMGMFDEIRDEGMKNVAILGAIIAFVGFWLLYSVSIYLVMFVLILVAGGFVWWKAASKR